MEKMAKQLQKSLLDYLSKIKKQPTPQFHWPSNKTLSSSTSWILRGCKHPKTPSFAIDDRNQRDHNHDENAATLSDIDRFLFENFKSLHLEDYEEGVGRKDDSEEKSSGFLFNSPRFTNPPPPAEDMGSSSTTTSTFKDSRIGGDDGKEIMRPDDFIAVFTFSPNPYDDFRYSMQEMIEARLCHNGKVDWGFMEEILFCYLNLNDRKFYKYVMSAFVDLVVHMRENSKIIPTRLERHEGGRKRTGDQRKI